MISTKRNTKKLLLIACFSLLSVMLFAKNPEYSLLAKGAVYSIVIENDILYAATDAGSIDVFNWKTKMLKKNISFPMIKDFMGDEMAPKIYSIDKWPNKDRIIAVTQGKHGFRNIFMVDNGIRTQIFDAEKDKMMIKKALFFAEDKILLATLGNEIMLYDLQKKTFVYIKQLSTSVFSDFTINPEKTLLATADESGIIHIMDALSGELVEELRGQSVDNIYQLAFANNVVVGAGQDRRAVVYKRTTHQAYFVESSFLIYSVGISDDGKYAAFSSGEKNNIQVFNTSTKKTKVILEGQRSTLTQIKFVNQEYMITTSEDKNIMVWKW